MNIRRTVPALLVSAVMTALATPASAQTPYDYMASAVTLDIESPIIVSEPRLIDDETINSNVVDALRNDPRLAGRIGVRTMDREVELTGIVTSPGMWRQAERDAKSVYGVRNVRNLLSTRIGGGRF